MRLNISRETLSKGSKSPTCCATLCFLEFKKLTLNVSLPFVLIFSKTKLDSNPCDAQVF